MVMREVEGKMVGELERMRHIYCRFYEVGCDYAPDGLGNLTLYRIDVFYYLMEVGTCMENCSSEISRP